MKLEAPEFLQSVLEIARRAGDEILDVYRSGDARQTEKLDNSPLTLADLRANAVIEARLKALSPGTRVLSEESAAIAFETRSTWHRYWLVDPLDGTREFLSRNGEFTVNIALIEGHEAVFGVVHVPEKRVTYWGARGAGAWCLADGRSSTPLQVRKNLGASVRVAGSRSHRGDSLDRFLTRIGAHEFVSMGSSLKFCLIADGLADVYPRLGPTSEWDTAAAQAVLEAAGGAVLTLDGRPLRYNTRPELLNPHFVAVGSRDKDWLTLLI